MGEREAIILGKRSFWEPRSRTLLDQVLNRPQVIMSLTFLILILGGATVLWLPISHRRQPVPAIDALFTSASAVCVTGLTTVNPATEFSRLGQGVILLLIQLGGLGLMTFGVAGIEVLRRRVSFSSQAAVRDAFFLDEAPGRLGLAMRRVILMTVLIEAAGTLLIYAGLGGAAHRGSVFEALFLAVSAFCNAGIALYPNNLLDLRDSTAVLWSVMILIVLGGLGYPVLFETTARLAGCLRRRAGAPLQWTLHTKVALATTAVLIVGGAAALLLVHRAEFGANLPEQVLHGLFHSITARTAGFNSIALEKLSIPPLLILMFLMFVGGSPASCAGGIKTTSAAVWAARLWARLHGRPAVVIFRRRIPHELVRRTTLIVALAAFWIAIGVFLLSLTQPAGRFGLADIMFEQFSALGTVGLSTGLTPALSTAGKLWIILSMFVGRVGPLTLALSVIAQPAPLYEHPSERVMIG